VTSSFIIAIVALLINRVMVRVARVTAKVRVRKKSLAPFVNPTSIDICAPSHCGRLNHHPPIVNLLWAGTPVNYSALQKGKRDEAKTSTNCIPSYIVTLTPSDRHRHKHAKHLNTTHQATVRLNKPSLHR
jgi:hypothetical protein